MTHWAQNLFYAFYTSYSKKKKVIFPLPYSIQKSIPYICDLLEKGKFLPVVDREYPLEDKSKAYEYVITGKKTGSVVINIFYS